MSLLYYVHRLVSLFVVSNKFVLLRAQVSVSVLVSSQFTLLRAQVSFPGSL